MTTKKAVIYARVSTDEQAEKGHSLNNQIEECTRYAEQKGIEVVECIREEYSGATLNRPGFQILLKILSEGRANAVIVLTADRLSRDYVDAVLLTADWKKQDVEIHRVDTGQATNDVMGKLFDAFVYLNSEEERRKIRERTMMGRNRKAKDGQRPVMSGLPPYGYSRIGRMRDAEMVINPEEAETIRMIFRWYTSSRDGGPFSLLAISNRLDAMGIRPRYASFWKPTSVRIILKNEIYAGKTYYRKTMIDDKRQVERPREDWIPIEVPHLAIIDKQTFDQAQVRARLNQERAQRNRRGEYLLTGHIRCGSCGLAMYGFRKWQGASTYYRCASYNHKGVNCQHNIRSISAKRVDSAVWEWLCSLLENEANLKRGIAAMSQQRADELQPKKRRLETVKNLLEKSVAKTRRLVDELAEFEGTAVRETVKEKIKLLDAEQKMLSAEKNEIESELAQMEIAPEVEDHVLAMAAQVRTRLPDRTFENMRYLLDRLNVNVVFRNEIDGLGLKVSCAIPGSEGDIVFNYS
jgi:site-specific DNA recombinase